MQAKARELKIQDGRLVRPGFKSEAPVTMWHNGRQRFHISEMKGTHIISVIKKLQEGAISRRSIFTTGKKHPAYKALIEEAAKRGLCLNENPLVSNVSMAAKSLRRPSAEISKEQKDSLIGVTDKTEDGKVKTLQILDNDEQPEEGSALEGAIEDDFS